MIVQYKTCSLQAIYVYQKAAILSMMSEEELKRTGENVVELFRSAGFLHVFFKHPELNRPM